MIKKFVSFVMIIGVIILNFGYLITPRQVTAAGIITAFSDTVSNLTASAPANHTIVFTTPTGVLGGQTITLTFDGSLNMVSVAFGDIDLQDNGVDVAIAATPTGATWGVNKVGQVITFTNGTTAVPAGHTITIKIGTHATGGTYQITNGSAGTAILRVGGTFTDTGTLSLAIVTNSIVLVAAEVLSTLAFSVSQNALYFGQLRSTGPCFAQNTDPGPVTCPTTSETEAFQIAASTNGASGYTISVQGDTLKSGVTNTITPLAANTASVFGTEQFGMRMTKSGSGTGNVLSPYDGAGYAYTANQSTPVTIASVSVPSLSNTYSVRYLANIAPQTEAGSYSTSHTYIATGNF